MENEADALVAAQDAAAAGGGGGASTPKPGLEGGRQRRRSLSDMFDVAPVRKPKHLNRDWSPRFSTLRDKNGWI